jgi:hypothetical protein
MPIIVAHPNVWTLLGGGPLRVFPKSWRIGVIVSARAPCPSDEPEDVVQRNCGQDYNVMLPVYARPLDGDITSIGVIPLAIASCVGAATIPVNNVLPSIAGDAYAGSVLTGTFGEWSNTPLSYAYQFLRDGVPIAGAAGTATGESVTYRTVPDDAGARISFRVVAINSAGPGLAVTSDGIRMNAEEFGIGMLFVPLVA